MHEVDIELPACAHGKVGFEPCQDCETFCEALAFGCQIVGHALIDVSVAGPDSGNVAVECVFCGWGWSKALY